MEGGRRAAVGWASSGGRRGACHRAPILTRPPLMGRPGEGAPRRPRPSQAHCSPEQAGGPLERPELGWSGGRRHGGGEPSPFGRAALLVEEQYGTLVAAAVAVVGRAEDGDDVLVVAPRVPG